MIHITEKQTGKILDYIPLGDFWDDNHHKSLKDTLEYFEFRTFGDKRYSQHLEKMNRIIIPDEDGTYIEFVIFHAIKYRLQSTVVVDVYAPASYLLLKKAKVIKPQRVSELTASQHLGFALNGTEWRPGIVESDKYRTLDIENHTNPYAYIRRIANEFELEPRFRVETDGNKVIGRYVDLLERVGEWQGREVEFGRDLLGIERKVDDSNVVTALIGLGPERDDGTRLEVMVEDEEALQRWGVPNPQTGELMHLIETYEPESTDQDMTTARLTELTRNELEKRINSVVEYTADVADLEKVPGMENKVIRFGDTIKIKDMGFNPPLYLEARVHTQDRSLSQPEKKKVTLGDYIEYTEEEVHAIWKQLQAEIAKKVSLAEVTEVVYTKPEVDERDDAVREHADNVAENAKIEAIQVAAEDASQKAKQAEDSAKEYTDGRLENTVAKDIFENTVTDLLNNIAQKVDSTRFEQVESELRGIAEGLQREIEEHADTLEEHGGKITKLETDVDEVEGKISTTIAELQSLEETASRHETQIEANAREIALKADKQELDLLSGTVSGISSELSVIAGKIEAKAERSEVEKLESDVSKVSQDVSKLTVDVDGIKTNVGSISQTVSNHGTQISNINSTLTQHANMIASKVEKSEFDSVTNTLGNRISTIEQTADSISLEVSDIKANVYTKSEVDSAIGNIQVGGRNLLRNSSQEFRTITLTQWGGYNQYELIWHKPLEELGLKNGDYITLSMYFDDVSEENSVAMRFDFNREDNSYISSTGQQITKPGRYSFTAKIPDNEEFVKLSIRLMPKDSQSNYGYQIKYKEAKLEKGNRATDWTPAPEDIDEKFTDIEGTLASHSTKIEQNAQQIQLRATKAEVDTLSGRVSTVESTIQQHADMIESKIDDGQARSIFRQEASSFTFDADQINFKGHVFGEDATFTGRLEGASGLFTGSLITQDPSDNSGHPSKTEITYDTFSRQVHNAEDEYWTSVLIGSSISMSKYDYSGLFGPKPNAYYSGGFSISEEGINFGVRSASPSGWYSVTIDLDGIHYSDPNDAVFKEILFRDTDIAFNTNVNVTGSIIASKGWFDGQVFELSNASLLNIYIRPQSGGSVRFTEAGTTTSYVPIYASGLYANSVDVNTGTHVYIRPSSATGEVRITTTGTTDSYRPLRASNLFADSLDVQGGNAVHVYVRPRSTGSLAVTATGTTDNWRPVEASGFQNRSLERYKQDIELWNGSALDIIRNSEIYQYRSKTDVQNGIEKLKYGFVIGEGYRTPNEVITPSGESVDIYVQSSVAWKAIQELDSIQMNHEDRIAQLEQKIAELEAKIT